MLQHKWLTKLLGMDYETTYKQGSEHKAIDALSRLNDTSQLYQISMVIPLRQHEVIKSYKEDEHAQEIITQFSIDAQAIPD